MNESDRKYLAERREAVRLLQVRYPLWWVMYGRASRMFWGFALFETRSRAGLRLRAPSPDDLAALMSEAQFSEMAGR